MNYEEYQERVVKEFYDKYPLLFKEDSRNVFGVKYGWWPLVKSLCDDLMKIIEESPLPMEEKNFTVSRVKEKFAGLRFYVKNVHNDLREKVQSRIDQAEKQSFTICEECGNPGSEGGLDWVKTLCDDCQLAKEIEACHNGLLDRTRRILINKMGLAKWKQLSRDQRERLVSGKDRLD